MTETSGNIESRVRDFLLDEIAAGMTAEELPSDLHLVNTGVLDSINVLQLVDFIEEGHDVELVPEDVQGMVTISAVADLIRSKRGE